MATYPPPNYTEAIPIFNTINWETSSATIDVAYLNAHYLKYPVAQGLETFEDIIVNGSETLSTNLILDGVANTNYIQFPDGTKQYTAPLGTNLLTSNNTWTGTQYFNNTTPMTTSATQPASTDASTKIPTTAWVQSAITTGSSPILSSVGINPQIQTAVVGTWNALNTTAGTTKVDIWTIGGGGMSGTDYTPSPPGWGPAIGGCGGGGGLVCNKGLSLGGYNNAIAVLTQPQYVGGTTNSQGQNTNWTFTSVWTGTFTQSGTTITLTTTTSGAMSVGTILYYTKSAFDASYPSTLTPYGAYFNQLQIVSGSGTTWQVQSQQSQTLPAPAVAGTGYTPAIVWEGTFTQSGTTITAVSTTSGTFTATTLNGGYWLVCTGTSANQQYLLTEVSTGVVSTNTSQTITTPTAGRILYTYFGNNVMTKYLSYGAGMNNGYTYFPYIAWCEGGFRGTNGSYPNYNLTGGQGGYGGTMVCYLPAGSQTSNGAKGQNGGVNDDPSGFTKVSGQGGYSYLTNGVSMTINGTTTLQPYQYNQGGSTYSSSGVNATQHYKPGQGGVILVCYKY